MKFLSKKKKIILKKTNKRGGKPEAEPETTPAPDQKQELEKCYKPIKYCPGEWSTNENTIRYL